MVIGAYLNSTEKGRGPLAWIGAAAGVITVLQTHHTVPIILVLVSSLHTEGIHRVSVAMGQVTSEATATTPRAALHLIIVKMLLIYNYVFIHCKLKHVFNE